MESIQICTSMRFLTSLRNKMFENINIQSFDKLYLTIGNFITQAPNGRFIEEHKGPKYLPAKVLTSFISLISHATKGIHICSLTEMFFNPKYFTINLLNLPCRLNQVGRIFQNTNNWKYLSFAELVFTMKDFQFLDNLTGKFLSDHRVQTRRSLLQ